MNRKIHLIYMYALQYYVCSVMLFILIISGSVIVLLYFSIMDLLLEYGCVSIKGTLTLPKCCVVCKILRLQNRIKVGTLLDHWTNPGLRWHDA